MMDSNIFQIGEFFVSLDERRPYFTDLLDLSKRTYVEKGDIFFCFESILSTHGSRDARTWICFCSAHGLFMVTKKYAFSNVKLGFWKALHNE